MCDVSMDRKLYKKPKGLSMPLGAECVNIRIFNARRGGVKIIMNSMGTKKPHWLVCQWGFPEIQSLD